jgi:uncharacterized protein (DUF1330 family)
VPRAGQGQIALPKENTMTSPIVPTPEQIQTLIERGPEGALVMVNLLKYRAKATYPADKPEAKRNLSGREAYQLYGAGVQPILAKIGARIVWMGMQKLCLIGDANMQEWDDVACVRYPSRQVFMAMAGSAEYQAISYHRDAGLERTALLCCDAGSAA